MDVPMLDEVEFEKAYELYGQAFRSQGSIELRFKPLLNFYNETTGWNETVPAAIMHHRIAQYGPPCENCNKPYRTPEAKFCAACGHKRSHN